MSAATHPTGDPDSGRSQYRIESLAKGLQVLRLFDASTTSLRLREVADRTGLPMPTAFRIVATLEQEGFVERDEDGGIYPGLAVLTLGSSALHGADVVQASERPLRALATATGETVNLGVLLGDQVLCLARLRNADLVSANIQVGSTLPAVWTSMGKLLLAFLPSDEVSARLGPDAFSPDHGPDHGPNAVTSREQLDEQLVRIRTAGYAVQDQELGLGLRSVAVPIFGDGKTPVAAINVAVSALRRDVDALRGPILARAREAAHEIGLRLGAT
jgi:IclR family pca regulon transcriptional regulator